MQPANPKDTHANCVYENIARPDQGLRRAFEKVGTADIAALDVRQYLLDGHIRPLWHGARAFGPALTVCNASHDTLMLHYAVELCQPGDILVISSDKPSESALWGKMLTVVAQARKVAGVVVDGPVRDTAYIRDSRFPVWARSISPLGSRRKGPGSINTPLQIGSTQVTPGNLLLADDDGIIVFPASEGTQLLKTAEAGMQKEKDAMPGLEAGISPFQLWSMQEALDACGIKIFPSQFPDPASSPEENYHG